jgi:hypothetical protein
MIGVTEPICTCTVGFAAGRQIGPIADAPKARSWPVNNALVLAQTQAPLVQAHA